MISRLVLLLFVVVLVQPSVAVAVTGGEVQVATNGQDSAERASAYRTGLRWLLNNRPDEFGSVGREQVNVVLNQAQNYVDAFEFVELPGQQALASVPVTPKVREAGEATHLLSVQYSVAAIQADLAVEATDETQEPVQRSLRTINSALFWLLIKDGNKDLIVSDATTSGVASRLRELAGGFGWVMDFPELDVTDLAFVGPDEIDGASLAEVTAEPQGQTLSAPLQRASARYAKDLVLTGTALKDAAGSWQLRVRRDFLRPDTTIDQTFRAPLQASGPNLDRLLQQAMSWNAGLFDDDSSDQIDAEASFAGNSLGDAGAKIYVAGVVGATQYLRLMRIVGDLVEVEESAALEIGQDSLVISVSPRSALASISSSLQSRDWLRLASRQQLQDAASTEFATSALEATAAQPGDPALAPGGSQDSAAGQASATPAPPRVTATRLPAADLFLQIVK